MLFGLISDITYHMFEKSVKVLVTQLRLTLCCFMDCSLPASSVNGIFSRQEYWRGCHSLCQGIFLTQESNPGLLPCSRILYRLSHQGSPILCIQEQIFIKCLLYMRGMKSTSERVQILILGSEE